MRKTESLAGVLDRCLARVQSGAATVEDCLRDYPELADQLGPLLRTALQAGDLLAPSGPTAAYQAASEGRLLNQLRAAQIGSGVGVAGAAAGSLPGDRLYGVKRGLEEVSLALSRTSAGDAGLLLGFAERRLAEAEALIEIGRDDDLPAALAGYERELSRLLAQE